MSDQIRVTPGVSRSTNPYHIARAYGAPAPTAAVGVAATVNSAPAAAVNGPSTAGAARAVAGAIKPAAVSGAAGVGAVQQQPRVTAEALKKIDRLVAAEVPGKAVPDQVSVGASRADEVGTNRQQAAAYQLYRRPTEENEVQTVLLVGRLLDTNG